jgi:hypothetical protein
VVVEFDGVERRSEWVRVDGVDGGKEVGVGESGWRGVDGGKEVGSGMVVRKTNNRRGSATNSSTTSN